VWGEFGVKKRGSSALVKASGIQLPTNPLVVMVMPSFTRAAASEAVRIGFLAIPVAILSLSHSPAIMPLMCGV
jgi:hypothetical protein